MKVVHNYTLTLNNVKIKIIHIEKTIFDLQSQVIYDDKNNSKTGLHILEDAASSVQVGDIEEAIF